MKDKKDKKKVGVVLSGCGVFDGSEIHEAVFTLWAIEQSGAEAVCMAPDRSQHHVINHLTGQEMEDSRNVLVESARIARGEVEDIAGVTASRLDALVFPGGFGAAKNLCTFAFDGPNAQVDAEVERLVKEMFAARKPIGFACIAPVIGAKVLGDTGVQLTIGNDVDTAAGIESCGARHVECPVREIIVDEGRKIVSTPAYMLGQNLSEVAEGIGRMVKTVVDWA